MDFSSPRAIRLYRCARLHSSRAGGVGNLVDDLRVVNDGFGAWLLRFRGSLAEDCASAGSSPPAVVSALDGIVSW
jgi:hypothetical protein